MLRQTSCRVDGRQTEHVLVPETSEVVQSYRGRSKVSVWKDGIIAAAKTLATSSIPERFRANVAVGAVRNAATPTHITNQA